MFDVLGYLSSWSFGTAQWAQKFWFILFCSGVMFTMNWHTGIACTEYCIYLDIERFESQGNECQQIYKIIDMEMHS